MTKRSLMPCLCLGLAAASAWAQGQTPPSERPEMSTGAIVGQAAGQTPPTDAPAAAVAPPQAPAGEAKDERSPVEKMNSRFPQPVVVGTLIGLRVLDQDLRVLGHVRHVAEGDGSIKVVIGYNTFLGFGGRKVGLPIEAMAMLGQQMMLLDLKQNDIEQLPTWYGSGGPELDPGRVIKVAITSR